MRSTKHNPLVIIDESEHRSSKQSNRKKDLNHNTRNRKEKAVTLNSVEQVI